MKPFFISVPHAGENVPKEASWLADLPESVLMCDSDRYVDEIYRPAASTMGVAIIVADTHRYVVDLNRVPEDIDQDSVEDSANPPGKFTTGFHWSQTTTGARLMKQPISRKFHEELTDKYYAPFHKKIVQQFEDFSKGTKASVFHLDAHSMPSLGTSAHRDPGALRPQIVVSDCDGTSCDVTFSELVIKAYKSAGFEVEYNWPYKGGRITQIYGKPQSGRHAIQVELNRSLYMNESTKRKNASAFADLQKQIVRAIGYIVDGLKS